MSREHPISDFTSSALQNLRSLVDVNTIIGDPISTSEGVVVIPISKVAFGYASGGTDLPTQRQPDLFGGGTGGGVTIQPLAFLVICGEKVELLQMQSADNTSDRIVNAVPGVLEKILDFFKKGDKKEEGKETGSGA